MLYSIWVMGNMCNQRHLRLAAVRLSSVAQYSMSLLDLLVNPSQKTFHDLSHSLLFEAEWRQITLLIYTIRQHLDYGLLGLFCNSFMFTIHPWNCDLDIYLIYNLLDSLSHIFEQEVYQIIFHQIQRLDCSLYVQTIHQPVNLPLGGGSLDTAHATQGVAECDTVHWVGTGLLLGEWRNHWFYARWMIAHLEPLGWLILGVGFFPLQWGFRLHLAWIVLWKAKRGRRTILSQSRFPIVKPIWGL